MNEEAHQWFNIILCFLSLAERTNPHSRILRSPKQPHRFCWACDQMVDRVGRGLVMEMGIDETALKINLTELCRLLH